MQGILIASAATGSPILSSRLDFHAQTLAQQALEALNTSPDPVLWLPLLHRPSAPTSTRGPPAKTGTGDYDENSSSESDSDITSAQEIWNQPNAGPSTRSSSQPTGGAAACVVRRSGLIFLVPVAADSTFR